MFNTSPYVRCTWAGIHAVTKVMTSGVWELCISFHVTSVMATHHVKMTRQVISGQVTWNMRSLWHMHIEWISMTLFYWQIVSAWAQSSFTISLLLSVVCVLLNDKG